MSVQRLHDLFLCLTSEGQKQAPTFARSAILDFSNPINAKVPKSTLLSPDMIISGIAVVLGRLAFQKDLMDKAIELFTLAKEKMVAEKVRIIFMQSV